MSNNMLPSLLEEEVADDQKLTKCLVCNEDYVPEVIIATINPPDGLQIIGKPIFIHASIIKPKKST